MISCYTFDKLVDVHIIMLVHQPSYFCLGPRGIKGGCLLSKVDRCFLCVDRKRHGWKSEFVGLPGRGSSYNTARYNTIRCRYCTVGWYGINIQRRNGIWGFHCCNVWNEMSGAWIRHDTEGGVPYSCAGHRVPYFAAVKDPNPVNGLLYALGIFLIWGK